MVRREGAGGGGRGGARWLLTEGAISAILGICSMMRSGNGRSSFQAFVLRGSSVKGSRESAVF